jgi:5'-3' exonuclease
MGINGLNPLIKRFAPDAFFTMPIPKLSGKRIAIDANNWMYTNMATARKKVINRTDIVKGEPNIIEIRREWFLATINFILGWLYYNVTPVFVFDGQHPPEKDLTKAKRRDERNARKTKIDALYAQIRNDPELVSGSLIEELRKELRNYNYILPEDFELFRTVLCGIGIPCLQANGDGEQLCSMLCVEGKVAAVFSADTDNLVYGCPLVINKFSDTVSYDEYGNRIGNVECVRLDRVLSGLNIPHSVFVDLCIMSGCDYNKNIPGYAAIKSYTLLQKWGSIDELPRNLNVECLQHVRCREIFKYVPSQSIIVTEEQRLPLSEDIGFIGIPETPDPRIQIAESPIEDLGVEEIRPQTPEPIGLLEINKSAITNARDYLEMVGVGGQIEKIITSYHRLTSPNDGTVEDLGLQPGPRYVPPPQRMTLQIATRTPSTPIALPIRFLTLDILPQPARQESEAQ